MGGGDFQGGEGERIDVRLRLQREQHDGGDGLSTAIPGCLQDRFEVHER